MFPFAGCDFERVARFRQAEQVVTGSGDEVLAGLRGVELEFGFVHAWITLTGWSSGLAEKASSVVERLAIYQLSSLIKLRAME